MRVPVAMQLDADGAFSFEAPLPAPEGNLGRFVDGFKQLVIPAHLRPPAAAVNWIPLSGDPAVDGAMRRQVRQGGGGGGRQARLLPCRARGAGARWRVSPLRALTPFTLLPHRWRALFRASGPCCASWRSG